MSECVTIQSNKLNKINRLGNWPAWAEDACAQAKIVKFVRI